MTDIQIRPYAADDFDIVTQIWFDSWESTRVPVHVALEDLRERWPRELAKGWIVHVANVKEEIVGFIAWREKTLEQLFIAPDNQGHGIGKRLLDFAKVHMPSGFRLHTAVQSRAGRFYDREGLRRGETKTDPKHGHQIIDYVWSPDQP